MGSMIQKIIAIFLVFMLEGSFIQATFYSPYDFNRHMAHFQRKNYQFWHELYRSNYQVPPFLRYSQPGFIHSGPLNKMHALDGVPMMPPRPQFNNQQQFSNVNNNGEQQWNALNDVYGNSYQQELPRPIQGVNDETSNGASTTTTTTTLVPPTKRTTRPRTTYTTRERTTVSLSTEVVTKPTVEMGPEPSTTEASTTPKPSKPSRKPSSELLQQIAQINNSSQGVLSQLGKPSSKPSTGKRPSASQLLEQIQKVNSSAQTLLSTLKPNVKFQGYELNKEIWTTARTTEATKEEIPVIQLQEIVPLVAPTIVIEDQEESTTDESNEKLILLSTSKGSEETIESRNSNTILAETTEMPENEAMTTDPTPEDMNELDNRHEEYDLGSTEEDENMEQTPITGKRRFDEDITTAEFEEDMTTTENSIIMDKAPEKDEELPFEEDKTEATTLSDDAETTTVNPISESSSSEEEDVDQELIQFLIIDIATSAAALQSVLNNVLDPLGLGLRPEFTLLEILVSDIRKKGKTSPEDAEKVTTQITKITSNFGLKRLRSTQILEHTRRLNKLGKLLKLSMSNSM